MSLVIHRDKTFEHAGRSYSLLYNGPGWGYEILDESGRPVADGLHTLHDVREHVAKGLLPAYNARQA
jgi:hypothetical protein